LQLVKFTVDYFSVNMIGCQNRPPPI